MVALPPPLRDGNTPALLVDAVVDFLDEVLFKTSPFAAFLGIALYV